MKYYLIPISADQLIRGQVHRCNQQDSVESHLQLMIKTWLGAYQQSPGFGSALRQFDFYMPDADQNLEQFKSFFPREGSQKLDWHYKIKLVVEKSLERSIREYEPRLSCQKDQMGHEKDIVHLHESTKVKSGRRSIKYKLLIKGIVNNQDFQYETTIELPVKPPHLI